MIRARRETMTEDERRVMARLEMALGEVSAVGEVEICQCLWPEVTAAALAKEGGERSKEMTTLRRRVRKIIEGLRIGYRSAILDTSLGYFYAADDGEVRRFCDSRHKRAMTSLVIESIARKGQPLDDGIQLFFEFLQSHEEALRRVAERQGKTHTPIASADVVAAVAEKAKTLDA